MTLARRMLAEVFGTFWLVFGGCGSAVLGVGFPIAGIGIADVAYAFGLTVMTMAYAIGPISGCHLNPAVTLGLTVARRFPAKEVPAYVVAQLVGALAGSAVLYVIASGSPSFQLSAGFAANGFAEHSPGGYSLGACFLAEAVLTFFFMFVILGATDKRAPAGFAPIPIGFALCLIHLIGIPVTNVSVNPARSTGPALFVGDWAVSQLWLFWAAPLSAAALAGVVYPLLFGSKATAVEKDVPAPKAGTVTASA